MCEVSDQWRHRGSRYAALKVHLFHYYNSLSDYAIMLKLGKLLDIDKFFWNVKWRHGDVITWYFMIFSIFAPLTHKLLSEYYGITQIIVLFMPHWVYRSIGLSVYSDSVLYVDWVSSLCLTAQLFSTWKTRACNHNIFINQSFNKKANELFVF